MERVDGMSLNAAPSTPDYVASARSASESWAESSEVTLATIA
jgi:hypothetical protein